MVMYNYLESNKILQLVMEWWYMEVYLLMLKITWWRDYKAGADNPVIKAF